MLNDNNKFLEYEKQCGSKFAATTFVAEEARKLAEKYHNVITHAEALHWVLSGEVPENIIKHDEIIKRRNARALGDATGYLSNILDDEVRQSVLKSLRVSKKAGHLIYCYEGVHDPSRKCRVRILTRKLWYEL